MLIDLLKMTRERLILRLSQLGYLAATAATCGEEELRQAVLRYQRFNGLEVDGFVGPETTRSLGDARFCALPDVMFVSDELNKWPNPNIGWFLTNIWPDSIPMAVVTEAFEWAFAAWRAVCGIRPFRAASAAQAHVIIESEAIDKPGSVLAWSELADGTMRPKKLRFDSQDLWVMAEQPPRYRIDLGRVAAHELGHTLLGIGHLPAGNLMQPTYDLNLRKPAAGDVAEAVARYGPPITDPVPPPVDPGDKFVIEIEAKGGVPVIVSTTVKKKMLGI